MENKETRIKEYLAKKAAEVNPTEASTGARAVVPNVAREGGMAYWKYNAFEGWWETEYYFETINPDLVIAITPNTQTGPKRVGFTMNVTDKLIIQDLGFTKDYAQSDSPMAIKIHRSVIGNKVVLVTDSVNFSTSGNSLILEGYQYI